jgi:hypothetical protein
LDLRGPTPSLLGHTVSGDVVLVPGSLGAADPGVTKMLLLDYPGTPSPPVNQSRVEGITEQACSQVATMDIMLWEVMAMADQDILHPIRVS